MELIFGALSFVSKLNFKSSFHTASGKRSKLLHRDHTEGDTVPGELQIVSKPGFNNLSAKL